MWNLVCRYLRHISSYSLRCKKFVGLLLFPLVLLVVLLPRNMIIELLIGKFKLEDSVAYCNSPHQVHGKENGNFDGYTLNQVQILIRHGDRAPIALNYLPNIIPVRISCMFNRTRQRYMSELETFQKLVYKDSFVVKGSRKTKLIEERRICRGGQLTPYGFLQHLFIGKHLQKHYRKFLSGITIPSDIHVQATDVSRTIQSAAALLTGIFHDQLSKQFSIPINVHKDKIEIGHMLLNEENMDLSCAILEQKTRMLWGSEKYVEFEQNMEPMMQTFAKVLDVPRKAIPQINRITDSFYTRLCHDQGVPYGPHSRVSYSLVKQAFQYSHVYNTLIHSSVSELQSLSLISQIAKQALILIIQDHYSKLVIFSGHDSMITPFLQVLDIYDGKWPPYASRIVLEFYRKNSIVNTSIKDRIKSTYFRVLYNGKVAKKIKFCKNTGELCALTDLFNYVSDGFFNDRAPILELNNFKNMLFTRIKALCQ